MQSQVTTFVAGKHTGSLLAIIFLAAAAQNSFSSTKNLADLLLRQFKAFRIHNSWLASHSSNSRWVKKTIMQMFGI